MKEERFRAFTEMQQMKVSLEEKKLAAKQMCEESKVLYTKADDLDPDVAKYVHQIRATSFRTTG